MRLSSISVLILKEQQGSGGELDSGFPQVREHHGPLPALVQTLKTRELHSSVQMMEYQGSVNVTMHLFLSIILISGLLVWLFLRSSLLFKLRQLLYLLIKANEPG